MKSVFAAAITLLVFSTLSPVHALPDGRELHTDCARGNAFSEGYCEGFVVGVLAAHMSPWVVNLQKGRRYFCIPGNVTFKQMTEIVEKYLAENPGRHRYRADTNVWTAMTEAFPCSND
jgi:hypothetical protein